ncbi:salicylate hydroxylase [Sulfitobacter brevis]|uniref:Salicylate hydroxylase n=1 Tax=Sulfitobacter brevis TaxID=74348 RepID=A0A1I1V3J6_9RHOB|nr:NAD(P)/FAD-dependent oxidoreductase [Sulfitobacter brevis]SFD77607.1 salicylate hydroxylase [Sulfitobacter brevis]
MGINNAIVIGGGIGGLATATALAQAGIAVTLLERSESFEPVGAGIQISPNGAAVLRALGLEPALRSRGAVVGQAVRLQDYRGGKAVARLDLTRLGAKQRYYFMHRADLVAVLLAAAKRANVSIEMDAAVAGVRAGALQHVQLANGGTRRAELVVAADGIHSVARPALNGADQGKFAGQVAWRAVIPNTVDHPDEARVTMGPNRHLVSYPIRDGREINLVAVEERADWVAEGWSHGDDPQNMKDAFVEFNGLPGKMIRAVRETTLWGLHHHPVAKRWHTGGVALLGDAAHPTLPFLAQGANMALEDAWVLVHCLRRDGINGLARYQALRAPRVERVIKAAEGNAWRYHLRPGPLRIAAHTGLRLASKLAPGRMIGAYDWLYGHDVTQA